MSQWISHQAKQQWQRILFSAIAGIFTWWYIHETLVSTRVFTDVPIYIQGLPPGKTLGGLRKDGRLMRQFSVTLKGRRKALETIKPDQIELLVNAAGKGDIWKEELELDSIRCLNPEVQIGRDVIALEHPPLQIRLTTKISRDIQVSILPPSGSLPKGYKLIDVWPDRLTQTVEGPEEAVQALMVRRLFLTFDLNRITKQQLERMSEEQFAGSEIFLKVPESWKHIDLPAPFGESVPLQDPQAESLILVILRPAMLALEHPIPIRISPLPIPTSTSPFNNRELKITVDDGYVSMTHDLAYWVRPVFIDGVSRDFLQTILPHLEFVVYVGTKGNISGQFEIANAQRAERKYIQKMMQSHFERASDEDLLHKRLRQQFWFYVSQMVFYDAARQPLQWDFTISGNHLRIKEAE